MANITSIEKVVDAIVNRIKKEANMKKSIICTVKTAPPNITLKYENIIIPTEQIYVANYLLQNYHRQYKIDGIIDNIELTTREISGTLENISLNNTTSTGAAGEGPHTHTVPTIDASGSFESTGEGSGAIKGNGTYQSHKDFWFTDTLTLGSEVLVELVNNSYVVVAQIVRMPSGAKEGA